MVIMVQKRMVSIQDPKKGKEEPTQETKGRSIVSLKDLANSFKVKVLIFVIVIFILVMIMIMIMSSGNRVIGFHNFIIVQFLKQVLFQVLTKTREGGLRHIVVLLYACFTVGHLYCNLLHLF